MTDPTLAPGRKADIWLARTLLGWQTHVQAGRGIWWQLPDGSTTADVPAYTTDLDAARSLAGQLGLSSRGRDPWRICARAIDAYHDSQRLADLEQPADDEPAVVEPTYVDPLEEL